MWKDCYPDIFTDQHTRSTYGNCLWGAVAEAQKCNTKPTLCWIDFIINTSRMRGWVSLPLKLVINHFLYWAVYLYKMKALSSQAETQFSTGPDRRSICKSSLNPYRFSWDLSYLYDSHQSWNLCFTVSVRQSDSPGCNTSYPCICE